LLNVNLKGKKVQRKHPRHLEREELQHRREREKKRWFPFYKIEAKKSQKYGTIILQKNIREKERGGKSISNKREKREEGEICELGSP